MALQTSNQWLKSTKAQRSKDEKLRGVTPGADARNLHSMVTWAFVFGCLALLFMGLETRELSCDQRPIIRVVSSLLAGVVASLLFTGSNWFRFGAGHWSLRATAGSAAFAMVFALMFPLLNTGCAAAVTASVLNVDVYGRVELAGTPAGIVSVRLPGLDKPVLTAPDGSFAIKAVPVGSVMHVVVEYGRQSMAFDVERPYSVRELHVLVDLASGKSRLMPA
jgi:hypothetical protein